MIIFRLKVLSYKTLKKYIYTYERIICIHTYIYIQKYIVLDTVYSYLMSFSTIFVNCETNILKFQVHKIRS